MCLMWPKSAKVELFSTNLAEILVKVAYVAYVAQVGNMVERVSHISHISHLLARLASQVSFRPLRPPSKTPKMSKCQKWSKIEKKFFFWSHYPILPNIDIFKEFSPFLALIIFLILKY